jgi:hypothetical protein
MWAYSPEVDARTGILPVGIWFPRCAACQRCALPALSGAVVCAVFAATMVRVTSEVTEGRLVACAVMVTLFPFGTEGGAVYVVMMPVIG